MSEFRQTANVEDSPSGGAQTACYSNSSTASNRRWELAGYAKTAACNYTAAVASFHAWEGGTGQFDCENLAYRLGPFGESYVNVLTFGFGTATRL